MNFLLYNQVVGSSIKTLWSSSDPGFWKHDNLKEEAILILNFFDRRLSMMNFCVKVSLSKKDFTKKVYKFFNFVLNL